MVGVYDVMLRGTKVGQVQVTKEGLYYRFQCRCRLSGDICRLVVRWDGEEEKLGILVPDGDGYFLDTRLPAKRLGQGSLRFFVEPNRAVLTGRFVPIYPEEPFSYIEKLKTAYLTRQGGQIGIIAQEKAGT